MEPEHESTIPVEGTSALPDTQVVVDHSGIAATMEKQGWSRQFSLESGIQESAFVERIDSGELARQAKELTQNAKKKVVANPTSDDETPKSKRSLLVESVLGGQAKKENHKSHKKGAFAGVFVPTCENMWGVLIFLRFYFVVGQAGIMHALLCVLISFTAAFCTPCQQRRAVLHDFPRLGSISWSIGRHHVLVGDHFAGSSGNSWRCGSTTDGSSIVELSRLQAGLWIWLHDHAGSVGMGRHLLRHQTWHWLRADCFLYHGILLCSEAAMANPWVTGISWETFKKNWGPHYDEHTNFGVVLSVFFPCFTGILSGANRADILKDPPRNIKDGTFGAIIFSFFMYSSFFLLWGCVADYRYLQGKEYHADGDDHHRRLAGGAGEHLVEEIVWNPFPNSAHIGIIISSLSQALQCLIVAPRLLQNIARDKILTVFDRIAPLSKHGEPVRALACTYVFGAALVLIGEVNAVAPLLTMCFLVAYTFMNFSCFVLTYVRSPGFRPAGMSRRRWRFWYMCTGLLGSCVCLSIMIIVSQLWAIVVLLSSFSLYLYINWRLEQAEWGSALDGIRYQLALNSLIQLEESGHHAVNWRPQVLVLYRIHLSEELKGIKHRDILRFYSYLRKGNGFAVVACVLESDSRDEHAMHKASIEKDVIKSIMKEENIRGFAECVVAPSWSEGVNYIIQLSGIGGLAPNTILVNWPAKWKTHSKKATEFLNVVTTALASEKSVLAVKGLQDMPIDKVVGTIDVWWMIHDGGFMILLSWLLVQHRMWRNCQIRIFTITEGVSEERAKNAAKLLAETFRNRRLFDVDVEVVIVDDEMIQPYTYDWSLRLDQRHKFVQQLHGAQAVNADAIPLEIDDLFKMEEEKASNGSTSPRDWTGKAVVSAKEGAAGQVAVCDLRKGSDDLADHVSGLRKASDDLTDHITGQKMEATKTLKDCKERPALASQSEWERVASFAKLNEMILLRSKRSQLVVMNMPDIWGTEESEVKHFMTYCDTMTHGLDRVLFVHSSGHEVFEIG